MHAKDPAVLYVPEGQAMHTESDVAPITELILPPGQFEHFAAPFAEYFPASHVKQSVEYRD